MKSTGCHVDAVEGGFNSIVSVEVYYANVLYWATSSIHLAIRMRDSHFQSRNLG